MNFTKKCHACEVYFQWDLSVYTSLDVFMKQTAKSKTSKMIKFSVHKVVQKKT